MFDGFRDSRRSSRVLGFLAQTQGGVFLLLFTGIMLLVAPRFMPRLATVRRREDGVIYVEQVTAEGELHGRQEIYVLGTLSAVRIFDRGDLIKSTEYWPDGSLKSYHRTE